MKQLVCMPLLTIIALTGAETVFADTTPERTRAVVTRSVEEVQRPERDRGAEAEVAEDTDDDGDGIRLNVSYDSQGGIDVTFEASGEPGDANISVSINGESVSGTGSQNDGGNSSADGADGEPGANGGSSDPEEEAEAEAGQSSEDDESSGRLSNRPGRDHDARPGADRTGR